ncbi:MAG: glycosyltransferase [Candidatus Gracilibacteria bacterium]|nr:glycosyltransferase [Candidatus Gracilibacteria bacterium]
MKVAVVHEMLIKMGGAENVVKDILDLYPEADLYTLIYDENKVSKMFPASRIKQVAKLTQFMYKLTKNQRFCLPFMARAVESLDLSEYDLVIASSSGFAHGCITKPETLFVVYYHSPARYLWDWTFEYRRDITYPKIIKKIVNFFLGLLFFSLRKWDYQAGQRHDIALAASKQVAQRISKYYRRGAQVVYPSVYSDIFSIGDKKLKEREYYMIVSALTEFKKVDIAVRAFNNLGYRFIIIGDGYHKAYLESIAASNIEFAGYRHWEESNEYYKNARGAIMPGKDDFGITPLEAMCAGVPVFGLGQGGLTETSISGLSGEFFDDPDGSDFVAKFKVFHNNIENDRYDRIKIRDHALKFRKERFLEELNDIVNKNLAK